MKWQLQVNTVEWVWQLTVHRGCERGSLSSCLLEYIDFSNFPLLFLWFSEFLNFPLSFPVFHDLKWLVSGRLHLSGFPQIFFCIFAVFLCCILHPLSKLSWYYNSSGKMLQSQHTTDWPCRVGVTFVTNTYFLKGTLWTVRQAKLCVCLLPLSRPNRQTYRLLAWRSSGRISSWNS